MLKPPKKSPVNDSSPLWGFWTVPTSKRPNPWRLFRVEREIFFEIKFFFFRFLIFSKNIFLNGFIISYEIFATNSRSIKTFALLTHLSIQKKILKNFSQFHPAQKTKKKFSKKFFFFHLILSALRERKNFFEKGFSWFWSNISEKKNLLFLHSRTFSSKNEEKASEEWR